MMKSSMMKNENYLIVIIKHGEIIGFKMKHFFKNDFAIVCDTNSNSLLNFKFGEKRQNAFTVDPKNLTLELNYDLSGVAFLLQNKKISVAFWNHYHKYFIRMFSFLTDKTFDICYVNYYNYYKKPDKIVMSLGQIVYSHNSETSKSIDSIEHTIVKNDLCKQPDADKNNGLKELFDLLDIKGFNFEELKLYTHYNENQFNITIEKCKK